MKLTMTREEREAFLADTHVGVFAIAEAGRGPCAVPVWYRYEPGGPVYITMHPDSYKARLLPVGRASLCAQQEALPSKYVSVEGPVEIVEGDLAAEQQRIALRYLGPKLGERYLTSMAVPLASEVLVVLRPERWWSRDLSRLSLR